MHFKWDIEQRPEQWEQQAMGLAEKLNISPILAAQLLKRGISTVSAAKRFFRPQLSDLLNPFLLKDMDIAVDRLNDAIGRKERIMVYGDYDVDGCTAVALIYKFLQQFYSNIDYYIPDRYDEGYGVSKKGIDYAKSQGVKLIIILDCGIKAHEEIKYAKEQGIDFIICDHHMPDDNMPPAVAILNPKRADDTYPFKHLCGCGVGFKFMQAFAKNNGIPFSKLMPLLDLCAISIATDLVQVTDENRILAYHGMKLLNQSPSVGVQAILDICGLADREISMSDIVFKIGPRLNASGRMENGKLSVDLLVQKNIDIGITKDGILPGGLKVKRHAKEMYERLINRFENNATDSLTAIDWINIWAFAVAEENACGGRMVTAPTMGSAGLIPAVLRYMERYSKFRNDADKQNASITFMATASAICSLYRSNASISGAEVGCQGEIGVACSMAAGGLAAALGGSYQQIENAAEIAMEHNLGLTCDPICGLVQVPCIERNAMGAIKAVNAARLALQSTGTHVVSLDSIIKTMYETGLSLNSDYKETSLAGIAKNAINC